MNNLGVMLKDSDPDQARHWFEQAAYAGYTGTATRRARAGTPNVDDDDRRDVADILRRHGIT